LEHFDKYMAIDMIEDALQSQGGPVGHGIATGLCSAFYLCGVLDTAEWETLQRRILAHRNRCEGEWAVPQKHYLTDL
jgi:hypothetical protein